MLCEKCNKKEASVFYEETINGAHKSYSLCTDCAAELQQQGGMSAGHFPFSFPSLGLLSNNLFGGLFAPVDSSLPKKKACSACGATVSDLRRNGRVGCPECYTTFFDELRDTIRSIHGNVKHVGRAPSQFKQRREKSDRLATLRNQLQDAVAKENFELAATLRDEIRSLEGNQ